MQHVKNNFLVGMQKIQDDIAAVRTLLIKTDARLHRYISSPFGFRRLPPHPDTSFLCRHLQRIGAGGLEFCFQMLLLMFRRELPWQEANLLWDSLLARHMALSMENGFGCPGCIAASSMPHKQPAAINAGQACASQDGDDVLRSLTTATAVALLLEHRQSYSRCNSVEEVVQLSNRLPDLGPGIGLRLAAASFDIISSQDRRGRGRRGMCGCYHV